MRHLLPTVWATIGSHRSSMMKRVVLICRPSRKISSRTERSFYIKHSSTLVRLIRIRFRRFAWLGTSADWWIIPVLRGPIMFNRFALSAISRVYPRLRAWFMRGTRHQTCTLASMGAMLSAYRRHLTCFLTTKGPRSWFWRITDFLLGMAEVITRPIPRSGTL